MKCMYSWFSLLLLLVSMQGQAQTTLLLAYADTESFPYQMGEGRLLANPPGVAVELIEAVAGQADVKVEFMRVPGKRLLSMIEQNLVDGGFIFSHNVSREAYAVYPRDRGALDSARRVATLSYYLYRMRGSDLDWRDGRFLHLRTPVGVNSGYSVIRDLKSMKVPFEEARTTAQNVQKLIAGRFQGYIGQGIVADAYLSSKGIDRIERVEPPIITKDYFLVFSHGFYKKNPQLAESIWDLIGTERDSFTQSIINKYQG